jgi:anti-sigma B factor antagonist
MLMFNVELSVDSFEGNAVVALYGELGLADAPGLASHLITAVAACGPSIVVDLAGLELVDSCGLEVLVRVLKWTRESGGDTALAAPQQQVRQLLRVTGLIDVFSVYPSVEQAASGPGPASPCRQQRHSGRTVAGRLGLRLPAGSVASPMASGVMTPSACRRGASGSVRVRHPWAPHAGRALSGSRADGTFVRCWPGHNCISCRHRSG